MILYLKYLLKEMITKGTCTYCTDIQFFKINKIMPDLFTCYFKIEVKDSFRFKGL